MLKGGFDIKLTNPDGQSVKADLQEAMGKFADLAENMPYVAVRAMNKTMTGTKTEMSKAIRSEYSFKAAQINKRLSVVRANIRSMGGFVRSRGKAFHLTDLTGTRQLKKGVRVKVKKDSSATTIPSAFIEMVDSGKMIVLRRPKDQSGKRYPRYGKVGSGGLWTVSRGLKGRDARLEWFMVMHPEYLYNSQVVWKKITGGIKIRVDDNIKRELDAEIRKIKGAWQ